MTGYNLPPGVNECDLPGNRPADIAWENMAERFCENCEDGKRCDHDIGMCDRAHEFEKFFEKEYYKIY